MLLSMHMEESSPRQQPFLPQRELSEFPQTLQQAMRSSGNEHDSMADNSVQKTNRSELVLSVLSAPDPPALWAELTGPVREAVSCHGNKFSVSKCMASVFKGLFPVLQWGRNYDAKSFRSDLMAGLTLASLGIPQSIGYANLAKLDPQYGLYTSIVPPLIYAVMGTSREIAIGPVAVISLLLSSMIPKIVDPSIDPSGYRRLVFTTTFFTGVFQAAFGFLRLGFLVEFLSHAAIVGFMGGAAIVIGLQQLKGLLGITHFTDNTDVVSVIKAVWVALHQPWHPECFLLGCSFLIFILITRFIGRRNRKLFWLPAIAPLLSVVLSTLLVFLTRADKHGVKTIQNVKGGFNPSSVKELQFTGSHVGESAKAGFICAIIALTEAIAVGRSFASVRGYQLDGNKEMVAFGFMNIAGSMSSCYVATGCKTTVSNIVMAITVFIALQLLTRLLYYTPVTILASIILSALLGLIDLREAYNLLEVDKMDFLTCLGAFLGVLFGSVEIGLVVAVTFSFARIVLNSIRPRVEMLGRIPGTDVFRSTRQYPMAIMTSSLLVTRINSSFLCFMNASFIRERIIGCAMEKQEARGKSMEEKTHSMVIDMSNVTNIDTSGIVALEEIHKKLASLGMQVAIANPGWHVIHKMKLARLIDRFGGAWIFLTVGEAVEACTGPKKDTSTEC